MDLFNEKNIVKALESLFITDRFVQWTGKQTPGLFRLLNKRTDLINGNVLKVYNDNGYYLAPVGSWIVRAPDGKTYAFGEGVRFVANELDEAINTLQKEIDEIEIPIHPREEAKPKTMFIPEDIFETEVVEEGNGICLRRKLDKDGKPVLRKRYDAAVDTSHGKDWSSYRICNNCDDPNWKKKFLREIDKFKWKK